MADKKRYLITSALPYINGIKHLGNLIGSLLPADVYARFQRQRGQEVLFVCATDEHGTPAELAAAEAGLSTADYCDREYKKHLQVYQNFYLSFDHFGRTSRPQNFELTQHFCAKLSENGLLEERTVEQLYSRTDRRFLPDRYVVGTCPHCGFERARGDQCEQCVTELDPTDLLNPRSAISGSQDLELRSSRHLYLLLPKMAGEINQWVSSKKHWPVLVTSIANKWLKEGLQPRCITRDLEWGIPVNRAGFENKVFYVWFDAPIGYIAATKEWADLNPAERDWKSWWYNAEDVIYTQFLAKDNIPFHTISFPTTLLGAGEPWKLVDYLKGFNWLTYYGGKFSTSAKRGIFMKDALDILPADYWRYYLVARAPESSDSAFTWTDFQAAVNKDLADVLGNLVNRSLRFCEKKFGAHVPEGGEWTELERGFTAKLEQIITSYTANLDAKEFRKSAQDLRALWSAGNEYLTEASPWTAAKSDPDRAACVLRVTINFLVLLAELSAPIIPGTAETLLRSLGRGEEQLGWPTGEVESRLQMLPAGSPFQIPPILFRKIDDSEVQALEARFGAEV